MSLTLFCSYYIWNALGFCPFAFIIKLTQHKYPCSKYQIPFRFPSDTGKGVKICLIPYSLILPFPVSLQRLRESFSSVCHSFLFRLLIYWISVPANSLDRYNFFMVSSPCFRIRWIVLSDNPGCSSSLYNFLLMYNSFRISFCFFGRCR